jgi:glutaconate CoA-transferase, subunit B
MTGEYTVREQMAAVLARDLQDGELLQVGVAMPVAELAVRLAHLMHGPNMELIFFGGRMNVHHLEYYPIPEYGWDNRVVRWTESYSDRGHRFDQLKDWGRRVFFIGGIQVDQFGNTNLIGIGEDFNKLRFRGPGSVGTPTLSSHVGRYHIVLNDHNSRVLVEQCDFVSTVGWGRGGADARSRLGLPGGGPKWCVTPLCVMDFCEQSKRMRLRSLHRGITVDEVQDNTGFELLIPDAVPSTDPPSVAELDVLRTRVDPDGLLRGT